MKTGLPVKAGWRNGSIKHFLKKMDEGSKDTGAVSPLKNLLFQPLLYIDLLHVPTVLIHYSANGVAREGGCELKYVLFLSVYFPENKFNKTNAYTVHAFHLCLSSTKNQVTYSTMHKEITFYPHGTREQKTFKTSPHTGGTCLRQWSREFLLSR